MDIKRLLTSVSQDNRGSFELFYNLFYDQIFRFSYCFLKDKEACREVITDVFFSVWQSRVKLKDVENIETYLYVSVRNEVNRYLSRYSDSSYLSLDEIPISVHEGAGNLPEDGILSKEFETVLTKAINQLPEKCRVIFLMVREEGLKPKQIAEILSIKESTVRVQMKTAIAKIVEIIKAHFPDLTLSVLFITLF